MTEFFDFLIIIFFMAASEKIIFFEKISVNNTIEIICFFIGEYP